VADDTTEAEEQLEYGGGGVYTPSVGAGLPALLRADRAGPAGDPVFFLLTAVAVTVRLAWPGLGLYWLVSFVAISSWAVLPFVVCAAGQTSVAFSGMVAVAIPTMLVSLGMPRS
jgi:hypothetical protein